MERGTLKLALPICTASSPTNERTRKRMNEQRETSSSSQAERKPTKLKLEALDGRYDRRWLAIELGGQVSLNGNHCLSLIATQLQAPRGKLTQRNATQSSPLFSCATSTLHSGIATRAFAWSGSHINLSARSPRRRRSCCCCRQRRYYL